MDGPFFVSTDAYRPNIEHTISFYLEKLNNQSTLSLFCLLLSNFIDTHRHLSIYLDNTHKITCALHFYETLRLQANAENFVHSQQVAHSLL